MTIIERERLMDALLLARERSGLSQRQLGRLLGVSHTTISYWETGMYTPSPRHLERMDHIFWEGWRV